MLLLPNDALSVMFEIDRGRRTFQQNIIGAYFRNGDLFYLKVPGLHNHIQSVRGGINASGTYCVVPERIHSSFHRGVMATSNEMLVECRRVKAESMKICASSRTWGRWWWFGGERADVRVAEVRAVSSGIKTTIATRDVKISQHDCEDKVRAY